MIAEPPFDAGGVNVTEASPFPAVAAPIVGVPGTVAAVTELEGEDAALVPAALVAVRVKVYAVPLVRPVTTMGEELPVAVIPPGDEMTV